MPCLCCPARLGFRTHAPSSPSHRDQRDPGIPQLPRSPPGLFPSACLGCIPVLTLPELLTVPWPRPAPGWALGSPGRHGDLARGRVGAGIQGMRCPIPKTQGAGIALRSPRTAGVSTSRGRGSPHHRRRHTRFPAASQPFCSPSSIYLIINSAITINSWGCCSHVDQSSAVVRAEQGHVSSPGGLLSPGINCSGHVCHARAGPGSLGSSGGSSLIPLDMAPVLGVTGTGGKTPLFAVFCGNGGLLSAGGWLCLVHP